MIKIFGEYGYNLCGVSHNTIEDSLRLFESNKVDGFSLASHQINGDIKSLIETIPCNVKAITMLGLFEDEDYSLLRKFQNLEFLTVYMEKFVFEKTDFPNIKIYSGVMPTTLELPVSFKNLSILYADKMQITNKSLEFINSMPNLKNLTISRGIGDDLSNLKCELEEFTLGYCKNVTDVETVFQSKLLKEVTIYNCPKLKFSGHLIKNGSNLEKMEFTKISEIESFNFCRYAPNLRILTFDGTPVTEKDISPLLECHHLIHLYGKPDNAFKPSLKSIVKLTKEREKNNLNF